MRLGTILTLKSRKANEEVSLLRSADDDRNGRVGNGSDEGSPPEQDIGYELVATLSVDGQAVVSFDSQWNIVDLQTPVMLNMEVSQPSAQVVDAYSSQTSMGEISMTLVAYMWPNDKSETMNLRNDYTSDYASTGADAYSFTASRTAHT